ncbi:GIY-YIG nuclease family protein [Flavobacterium sp. Sd200]|uniref:GIY-YIG nuclease family protein n=1 Tax=Flavobacterium sp. Sd200 TaxID=2692211 RepID=UPI00136BEBBD|nr:GIY-YIG nuclease family protein [Flavobacterium sp. Sd200]MXN92545.1 GIY-YIG nuclease family protein [Flavobacterium sp. Sd200]
MQNNIVYILFSKKLNRYYIGYTSDMDVRISFHQNAQPNKFTAKANDWELILQLECQSKAQALAVEKHIKTMKSKVYIQNLIKYPEMQEKLRTKYFSAG